MATITFDTRKAVRKLQAAGFPEPMADGIVDTVAEAFTDTVATKTDIAGVKIDIAEVKAEIARSEGRVFRALWIQGGGIVALIVGLTKLL